MNDSAGVFLVLLLGGGILWLLIAVARNAAPRPTTILICGATGVGKSTLINVIAGRPAAQAGIGSPVTQNTVRIEVPEKQFAFYDSRGLEVAEASQTYLLLLSDLLRLRYTRRVREQVELVLICIQEPQGRIDDAHREIAGLCEDLGIPFGIAITKTEGNPELSQKARASFPGARFVLQVRSLELRIGALAIPPEGIETLEDEFRRCASWSAAEARMRAGTAMQTEQLSTAARALAATGGKSDRPWLDFAAASLTLLSRAPRWDDLVRFLRNQIRSAYVPGAFRRTFLTKFDNERIDGAVARRLVPIIVRRFGDRTGLLTPEDHRQAHEEAKALLDSNRPYRSRFS